MCWRTAICKLSTGYSHWALESHISSFSTGCWVVSRGVHPSSNLFKVLYSEGLSWHGRETSSLTHCSTMVGLVPIWKCPQDLLVKATIAKYPLKMEFLTEKSWFSFTSIVTLFSGSCILCTVNYSALVWNVLPGELRPLVSTWSVSKPLGLAK